MTARIPSARLVIHGSLALLVLSALLAFLLLTSSTAHGATFLVNSTADEDDNNVGDGVCEGAVTAANCSLRAAVQEANALAGDDLITLPAGTYTLTIGQIEVSGADELTIAGPDASVTVIDGNGGPRVFEVVEFAVAGVTNLHLSGVTITNGDIGADNGGGIWSQGAVTLTDSIVDGNLAGRGAGIYNAGGRLTLIDTSVSSNIATGDGGGIYNDAGVLIITGGIIQGNSSAFGGGIWSSGDADLQDCTIFVNISGGAFGAGGIANRGTMALSDCLVSDNFASPSGSGGIANRGILTLTGSTVAGNFGDSDAGGIWNSGSGTLVLIESAITGNSTNGPGGGIYNLPGGVLEVTGGTIADNAAATDGGGIRNLGTATLRDAELSGNTAGDDGGAISNDGGSLTIGASEIRANDAADRGGGIENDAGTLSVSGGSVAGNSASFGGGIWSDGTASLTDCAIGPDNTASGKAGSGGIANLGIMDLTDRTVNGNSAGPSGAGGISNRDTLTLTGSAVADNFGASDAGGIWNDAGTSLTLTDSTIANNVTEGPGGGIVVHAGAVLDVTRSTIHNNTAGDDGGGIWNGGAMVTLENSTISGNATVGDGGGIVDFSGATLRVLSSTISGNIAGGLGGGIGHLDGVATLKNSIVAGNTASDCAGAVISFDNNLDGDGSCNLIAPGDLPAVDPLLGPLADNGGRTRTHALLAGSPAIDAGSDAGAPPTDQRGFPRLGTPDIGAFEFQSADADGDGFDPIAAGGTDCDDTDPTIFPGAEDFPGDGIDQDCSGADSPVLRAQTLGGGWNTLVFTGAEGTDPAELAALIGPRVASLWGYGATLQTWLVHRPGGLALLNTLGPLQAGQALFLLISAGPGFSVDLPDLLPAGPLAITLLPQWNFVGFTGADATAILNALAPAVPGVEVAFRFGASAQAWAGFFVGGAGFLNAFTTVDRLTALFVFNGSGALLTM